MTTEPITRQLDQMRRPLNEIPADVAAAIIKRIMRPVENVETVAVARFGSSI